MHRNFTVPFVCLVSSFVLLGCPEKKAEKEAPATADEPTANDQSGAAEDKKAEEKPAEKADKKEKDSEDKDEKDEGGW